MAAFVASEVWREPPWVAESATPRDETSPASPHDRVQVFLNDVLVDSQGAGNGILGGAAHAAGSMAVKVLVDAADQPEGHAAMLKVEGEVGDWIYWCDGTAQRCGVPAGQPPIYGLGLETECAVCHAGLIFNAP